MMADLGDGEILDGRFRIRNRINQGGFASVFDAIDLHSGKAVALKVPFPGSEADPIYYSRFLKEEAIGRELDHASVVRVLPADKKSRPYIVMERLEGKQLSEILREGEPLPIDRALDIAARVARALEYLHARGVIHRDLKPGNIMLCSDGSVKVIDLGLATSEKCPEAGPPLISPALGTPDYMPPEQVMGTRSTPRSDLYSLGTILYEMATGSVPFHGEHLLSLMHARVAGDPEPPSRRNPALSPQVEEIILRAMARDPADRYRSASEMLKDLEDPGRVVPTGRASRLRAPSRGALLWLRVRGFVLPFFAIMLFFVLAILFVWIFGRHR